MLDNGQPPPAYRAPPPNPAALFIALTPAQAVCGDGHQHRRHPELAASTRLGVKCEEEGCTTQAEFDLPNQPCLSDSNPVLIR